MTQPARALLVFVLATAAAAAAPARCAAADDAPKPGPAAAHAPSSNADAEAAIAQFREHSASASPTRRLDAVANLARVVHPSVADVLVATATDESAETRVRIAAFGGLATQTTSAKAVGPKISKFLAAAAEENRRRKARGNYGVVIDPKTGDVDLTSVAGKAALMVKRERGRMLCEAVRALDALGHRDRDSVEVLGEFLADGCDELVAEVLAIFGRWKEWTVLPDLLSLFEMYPAEDKVNVGSVHDEDGDNQSAKRTWMSRYGDPDRRRPRPVVVKALRAALTAITGETFATPQELRDFAKRPEIKRKIKSR